jgi:hypothetical protein
MEEEIMIRTIAGVAVLAAALAGCGTEPRERTTGGAAAGAATGAGVGALGGPVGALAGAAIGGGAGAITGSQTSPEDVNLGRPPWRNPEVRTPADRDRGSASTRAGSGSSHVRQAQNELNQRGFNAGTADGVWGAQSSRAARDFQRANNLPQTGRLDSATMQALNIQAGGSTARSGSDRDRAYMGGGMVGTPSSGADTRTRSGVGTSGRTGPTNETNTGTPSTSPMTNSPGEQSTTGRTGP